MQFRKHCATSVKTVDNVLSEYYPLADSILCDKYQSMYIFNANQTVLFSRETGGDWQRYSTNTVIL